MTAGKTNAVRAAGFALCGCLLTGGAAGQSGPHANGVLIPHIQPDLEYSFGQSYEYRSDLRRCEDAVVEGVVPGGEEVAAVIFYVLAGFEDSPGPVELAGAQFGFRSYDAGALSIADHGLCNDGFLYLATDGWPGPHEGVALVFHTARRQKLVELAWFATYVYAPVDVPLGPNPAGFTAPTTSQGTIEDIVEDFNLGILAFGQEGYNPCRPIPREGACCLGSHCQMMYRQDCEAQGGVFHGDNSRCFPNPCQEPLPTTWGTLKRMYGSY
jgi:hypothetical protein